MINKELKENKMLIVPLGKFGYQLTPITENAIVITLEEFEGVKNRTKCFDLENNCVIDYDNTEDLKKAKLEELRAKRESVCFSIINRGQLWYDNLTEEQKEELKVWYKAWLDVTETSVEPIKPEWLK